MTLNDIWEFCKRGYEINQALRARMQELKAEADELDRHSWQGRMGNWCWIIGWILFLWYCAANLVMAAWCSPPDQQTAGPILLHALDTVAMQPWWVRFVVDGGQLSGAALLLGFALTACGYLIALVAGLLWKLFKAVRWCARRCVRLGQRLRSLAARATGTDVSSMKGRVACLNCARSKRELKQ